MFIFKVKYKNRYQKLSKKLYINPTILFIYLYKQMSIKIVRIIVCLLKN